MNRRNLLKTLLGTSVAITIPWAIPREPWEKLKKQASFLVKKWEPVLAYTSDVVRPLEKNKWEDMACLMEYTEQKYLPYIKNGSKALHYLIPAIRRYEGKVDCVEGEIGGRKCIEFKRYLENATYYWLDYRDCNWAELTPDFSVVRCYLT